MFLFKKSYLALACFSSLILSSTAFAEEHEGDLNNSVQIESPSYVVHKNSWGEMKQSWKDDLGLDFNIDYNMLGLTSSNSFGESSAGAGALRLFGQWDFVETESGSKGGMVFKFEHRHKYTDSSPKDFGLQDLGYLGFVHSLYGDQGFRATHLYWRQTMLDDRMVAYAGFLDMTDYFDFYTLANPWTDFNNSVFSTGNGTIGGLPDGALGVMLGGFLTDSFYASASVIDAKGNASDLIKGAKDFIDDGATWKSVEFGYTPSQEMLFLTNTHLSLWQRDAVGDDLEGHGINVSVSGLIDNQWLPFLRAGWAEDGGAVYDASVSAGFGYIPASRTADMFGLAINWASPMASTFGDIQFDDQYTAEVYYRAQVTPWLQLSPSIQMMNYTAINFDAIESGNSSQALVKDKTNVVFGINARFMF